MTKVDLERSGVTPEQITRIEGVIGVHSSFVLRQTIDTTALPLGYARAASS